MNDLEKTQPLLAQEANEEALQEKPAVFQGHFPVLDEDYLEEVAGGTLPGCCTKPRTSSPLPTRPSTPSSQPIMIRSGTSPRILSADEVARLRPIDMSTRLPIRL
jgi:hypothetical protein